MRRLLPALALSALALACASSPSVRAGAVAGQARSFGDDVRALALSVDLAAGALSALAANPGDSPRSNRETFGTFERELANLRSGSEGSQRALARLDARAGELFGSWSADTAAIADPELKASAAERRAALQASYARVSAGHAAVEPELAAFLRRLEDVRLYLANDLTAAGIASARSTLAKTCAEAAHLRGRLEALARESDAAEAALAPLGGRTAARR